MSSRRSDQTPVNPRSKQARKKRKRTVRAKSLAVLIATSAFIGIAPISWNRLPNFGLAAGIPRSGDPTGSSPIDPERKIDPETIPDRGTLITPQGTVPKSSSKNYAYFSMFKGTRPFVSSCKPYRYVIRRKAGPPNGDKLVREALQRISNVTQITFEWGGFTNDIYAFNKPRTYLPFDSPERELWIGWAFDDEVPDLGPASKGESYAVGVGGPYVVEQGGRSEVVGGGVVLRADESLPNKFGPGNTAGNILVHELLHSLGLDHVDVEGEVMRPSIADTAPDALGPGDIAGLQSLDVSCPT
jgi:Matrixin